MRNIRRPLYIGILLLALLLAACASTPAQEVPPAAPGVVAQPAPATPEQESAVQEVAAPEDEALAPAASITSEETALADGTSPTPEPLIALAIAPLKPYPYTTPLPPPTPTHLDGVYARQIPFTGTPVPCRRCAPYRLNGGDWRLYLDRGAFRVLHTGTGFQGVGSFTLSEDEILLFNDPNCHLEVSRYQWRLKGSALMLTPLEDTCGFGLRAANLSQGRWERQDPCQPPSMEAAVTGHWPAPAVCN